MKTLYKLFRCVKYNVLHFYYVFTFRNDILDTVFGEFMIHPSAIRNLIIGLNDVSFEASFRGNTETVVIDFDYIKGIKLVKGDK